MHSRLLVRIAYAHIIPTYDFVGKDKFDACCCRQRTKTALSRQQACPLFRPAVSTSRECQNVGPKHLVPMLFPLSPKHPFNFDSAPRTIDPAHGIEEEHHAPHRGTNSNERWEGKRDALFSDSVREYSPYQKHAESRRMTRGRCGSPFLHRTALSIA